MIDRFNFYDVYGYLLPGLALVALFGLPGLMIVEELPSSELVSALAAVAVGYVVGQLAHAFARALFEQERPFAAKVAELPLLAKARLERRLAEACGRPIAITDASVFDICRRVLQDQKRGQLADQFQGTKRPSDQRRRRVQATRTKSKTVRARTERLATVANGSAARRAPPSWLSWSWALSSRPSSPSAPTGSRRSERPFHSCFSSR